MLDNSAVVENKKDDLPSSKKKGRKKNPRIKRGVKCSNCNNNKAWTSRGEMMPLYSFKCSKCKVVIR
jgi:hypothetical protein